MNRRSFLGTVAAAAPVAMAGCAGRVATHSEVSAVAQVVDVDHHDGATTAHIEVTNDDTEGGTVGLHVHYFHDNCDGWDYHTHMPTVYVPSGETVEIRDTYDHHRGVECVSAHVHE